MSFGFRITSLNNDQVEDWKLIVALTCRAMMYLGSSINPVIYAFVGQHFRKKLTETMAAISSKRSTTINYVPNARAQTAVRNPNKTKSTKSLPQSMRKVKAESSL